MGKEQTRYCSCCTSCTNWCSNKFCKSYPKDSDRRILWWLHVSMYLLLITSVLMPLSLRVLVDYGINDSVVIDSSDSPSYDVWVSNADGTAGEDIDGHYDIFLFHVVNPEDILNGAKPMVLEKGPYCFDEFYTKFDISFSEDGDVVTYNNYKRYIFNQDRTPQYLRLSDQITTLYSPIIAFNAGFSNTTASDGVKKAMETLFYNPKAKLELDEENARCNGAVFANRHPNCTYIQRAHTSMLELQIHLDNYLSEVNTTSDLMKCLYCQYGPNGASPFWTTTPVKAYFGWLNDTVMDGVNEWIKIVNETYSGTVIPIPNTNQTYTLGENGLLKDLSQNPAMISMGTNYTSIDDARRRRTPDIFKTGKTNRKDVGRFIRPYNMTSQWICFNPIKQPQTAGFIAGQNFPACPLFHYDWNDTECEAQGYGQGFIGEYANRAQGTDGLMFGVPKNEPKSQVYISDIERSLFLEKTSIVKDWFFDIPLRRYQVQPKDMANATTNPESEDYLGFGPGGIENLTMASAGVPVFASYPHFYQADERLVSAVDGLQPNGKIHTTYLDVELNTGLVARAYKRLQLNYRIWNSTFSNIDTGAKAAWQGLCDNLALVTDERLVMNEHFNSCERLSGGFYDCMAKEYSWNLYSNFNDDGVGGVFFPYGWADEWLEMDEDSARELNDSVYGLDNIADQIMIWSLVLAALCAAGIITIIIRDSRRHSETIKRSSNADDRFARLLADDEQIRQ